ncbi:MAG: hypothetical protein HGA23_11925, partial [Bacteroidales bacterium]|nr:hypothetical protein [Bacteroidales bacterium]
MNDLITYLLQSAAILSVLYSVYWLFLRKDTFFHVNRFYLLSSLLLALVVPLLDIRILAGGSVSSVIIMLDPVLITSGKIEKIASSHLSLFEAAGVVYFTGVIIFTLRFMIQLIQLAIIVRRNKITRQDGANIVFVDRGYSPFSFFNLIFIREEYFIDGKLTPILAHEKIHIHQYHTLDLLLIEIAIILQWFNPFAWFMGRSIKHIHEYLADEGVLKKGFLTTDYQTLILNEAMGLQVNNLTNNFNVSLIKNRITMMTKARSASWTLIKVVVALPAFFAVLFFFAAGTSNNLTAQETQQKATQAQATTFLSLGHFAFMRVRHAAASIIAADFPYLALIWPLPGAPSMDAVFYQRFDSQLTELREQGLFKSERVISSPQAGQIRANDADVI